MMSWKDYQEDKSLLFVLHQKISQAEKDCEKQKITKHEMAGIEEGIVEKLGWRFVLEITNESGHFSLDEIVKDKKANCLGYTQCFYVLGNAIGLSVKPIWVEEMFDYSLTPGQLHAANLVSLSNNKVLLVDFAFQYVSEPFIFDEQYKQVGNYWECKNKRNTLELHPNIQVLDGKGLVGCVHFNQGGFDMASGKYDQAIVDYTKATDLNPKLARAYSARGFAYHKSKQYQQAVSDYSKAIEMNPKLGEAYYFRGLTFTQLGQLNEAIADFATSIELNPKFAMVYFVRGIANISIGNKEGAKNDLSKAIELDESLKNNAMELSEKYKLDLPD